MTQAETKKQQEPRLYIALDKETGDPVALIKTVSAAKAHRYIARKKFNVRYAEQEDMLKAGKAGLEVEIPLPGEDEAQS